jgi:hypothetical protein
MTVKMEIEPRTMPNGALLVIGIRYLPGSEPGGDTRGRANPTIYSYAALKTGGLWYFTGAGKSPHAATWGAVEKWLARDNRQLVYVEVATGARTIYPVPVAAAEEPTVQELADQAVRKEW